jgi:histidyl-tRNA synthetase
MTIVAGGRYDSLIEQISAGLYKIPAFGFAFGVERLIEFFNLDTKNSQTLKNQKSVKIAIVAIDIDSKNYINQTKFSFEIFNKLSKLNYALSIIQIKKSISKTIHDLESDGYSCVIFVGQNELDTQKIQVKFIDKDINEFDKKSIEFKILQALLHPNTNL